MKFIHTKCNYEGNSKDDYNILNRKEEAFYCLERCIIIWEEFNYIKTKAKLIMMIAGLYLNDKLKSFEDTRNKAYEAMNIFLELEDWEGKAEANFLLAMITWKKDKVKQHKSDSLILRRQPRSEYLTEEDLEFETKLHKTLSQVSSIKDNEMSFLESARQQFCYLKHKYGMARVSLAIATRYIELASIDIWYVNSSKA